MNNKKRTTIGIIAIVLALLIIAGWYYLFSYESCIMLNIEEDSCGGSCNFKSVITHNYCK